MIPDPTHARCRERLEEAHRERDKLRRKAAELCNRVLSGTAGCSSRKTADLARELRELCRAG